MSGKQKLFAIISIFIIVLAFIIAHFVGKSPKVEVKPVEPTKTIVSVIQVQEGSYSPHIKVMGQVEAMASLNLTAEVSGKITYINKNFVPGGFIKKGEVILQIDNSSYKNSLEQAKADYIYAKASLQQALGQQQQAKLELKLYEKSTGKKIKKPSLALKQPALEEAKANLDKAKAELDNAKLNFNRANIIAPYNIIVYERDANLSDYASPGQKLAVLVNTDQYWIKASMPIRDLSALDFVTNKNNVVINLSDNRGTREASFFKILDYLDTDARFVGAIFTVKDPLLLKSKNKNPVKTLLLDDYVDVNITGKKLNGVFRIPLFTLKNNNIVWVNNKGVLQLVKVENVFQDNNYAYVKGLNNGDEVVTSDLSIVTPGMLLKVDNSNQQ